MGIDHYYTLGIVGFEVDRNPDPPQFFSVSLSHILRSYFDLRLHDRDHLANSGKSPRRFKFDFGGTGSEFRVSSPRVPSSSR
jgi:hypothetical protein